MLISQTSAWKNLETHYEKVKMLHLRELFSADSDRATAFSLPVGDLFIDYSKHRATKDTISLLFALAREAKLADAIRAMFSGEKINTTEKRSVLHVALRNVSNRQILVDGKNVMEEVNAVLEQMQKFSEAVRSGDAKGYSGKKFKTVINIGIGGSDLGPVMAYEALKAYSDRTISIRFVSNVDATHFIESTRDADPETTLFIVASKTFTTEETMTNAQTARSWVLAHYKNDEKAIASHVVALSTNEKDVVAFGIKPENMFRFWDWVGGRYSLTSAIGLPLMIAIGSKQFDELREGYHLMDEHFRTTEFEKNAPVIVALLGIWYNNFFGAQSHVILPYNQYLSRFPAYFQQGDMESNGKSATKSGERIQYQTGPIIWGEPGSNVEHSFTQLILQGTKLVPADFIGFAQSLNPITDHNDRLLAHMIAQTEALAFGKTDEELLNEGVQKDLVPHKRMEGNRPTTTILAKRLTPKVLGQLIALYEHKIFTQGVIWNINSFDQFGVELGKKLAKHIFSELTSETGFKHDSSTNGLIEKYRSWK